MCAILAFASIQFYLSAEFNRTWCQNYAEYSLRKGLMGLVGKLWGWGFCGQMLIVFDVVNMLLPPILPTTSPHFLCPCFVTQHPQVQIWRRSVDVLLLTATFSGIVKEHNFGGKCRQTMGQTKTTFISRSKTIFSWKELDGHCHSHLDGAWVCRATFILLAADLLEHRLNFVNWNVKWVEKYVFKDWLIWKWFAFLSACRHDITVC